ncbi:MAG: hypothetical protein AB7W47_15825 [Calditrichaceae bacterium]
MSDPIDDITIEWTDDEGRATVKELKKEILTKGAWATVMFMYQELNKATSEYGPAKFRIGRYQKRNGIYYPHSKFNISSPAQAQKIIEILESWMANSPADDK